MASRLEDVIGRGTSAARPLATAVAPGTLYYSTDTATTDRSNGTIWETYSDTSGGAGANVTTIIALPGYDGIDGEDGIPGLPGASGPQGLTGATGAAGITGATGKVASPAYPFFPDLEEPLIEPTIPIPGPIGPAGPGGSGDITGPSSSVDNAVTRFDGITGKIIQDSAATIDDSGALTINSNSGGGFVLNNPDADPGLTQLCYIIIQTAGNTRWLVGMSAASASGDFDIYNGMTGSLSFSVDKATGLVSALFGINVGLIAGDIGSPADGDIWYNTTADELRAQINGVIVSLGAGASVAQKTRQIGITVDGAGSVLSAGLKGFKSFPVAGTITGVRLLADQSGSIVFDIWKDTYANYPPTVADTITAAAKPTISGAIKSEDVTLTGWTTAVAAGDIFAFNIDSCATITRVILELTIVVT